VTIAKHALVRMDESVCLDSVRIPFGKVEAKKTWKISPDAFCQMAFHVAYSRMHSKLAPTYESCSTAAFWHGRTETIRTATSDMLQLVSVLSSINPKNPYDGQVRSWSTERREEVRLIIQKTATTHVALAKEAAAGMGVDRHLLALKDVVKTAKDANGLSFFNDTLYEYGGTWLMSSSNVSQPFMDWFNFGAVTGDGYGLGYNILDSEIHVGTSSFSSSKKAHAADFAKALDVAAKDLAFVLGTKL
jgi:hypothetical protein